MRSSDGHYWIALDHVRAVAALMVFTWHFIHSLWGYPIPFAGAPAIPGFALLDEGHTGVALFMVLSGYLFAKLLDGKEVDYRAFFWNRFLRLMPLLAAVMLLAGLLHVFLYHGPAIDYLKSLVFGVVLPTWPNGGWSITVEFHFYLMLPLFMGATKRWAWSPLAFVAAAIALRYGIFRELGEVQFLAYRTIVGRIDQFVIGIFAFGFREHLRGKHWMALTTVAAFAAFYYWFDIAGGYYNFGNPYPSHSVLWVFMPTIEAGAYAVFVAYYDTSFSFARAGISGFIGKIGAYSYSIYLLHPFVVFRLAHFVDHRIVRLSNFYLATFAAFICFAGMLPIGWLSFRFIELPFLRHRLAYVRRMSEEKSLTERPAVA